MIELFSVCTAVKQYSGCKDVTFIWFRNDPARGRRYRDLIRDCDPGPYAKGYIDELFTQEEAEALKQYLDRNYGDAGTNTIHKVDLPVAGNTMGVGAIAVGGGTDFYMLDKDEEYSLPFKVWGYFDLRGCELVDGSGRYGGYHFEASLVDGKISIRKLHEKA
jgi:hypothetical protein